MVIIEGGGVRRIINDFYNTGLSANAWRHRIVDVNDANSVDITLYRILGIAGDVDVIVTAA